jgi:hypothetical protein
MTATTSKPVKRWAPEVIELAYQTWAGAADRNVAETVRLLAGLLDEAPPDSTVYLWCDRDNWDDRRRLELSGSPLIPSALFVSRIEVAAPQAISFLAEVAAGQHTEADQTVLDRQIRAASLIADYQRSLILQAAKQDGRRKPVPQRASQQANLPTDPTELEALEARRREQRG